LLRLRVHCGGSRCGEYLARILFDELGFRGYYNGTNGFHHLSTKHLWRDTFIVKMQIIVDLYQLGVYADLQLLLDPQTDKLFSPISRRVRLDIRQHLVLGCFGKRFLPSFSNAAASSRINSIAASRKAIVGSISCALAVVTPDNHKYATMTCPMSVSLGAVPDFISLSPDTWSVAQRRSATDGLLLPRCH
jgi:hypothetical protein